MIWDEIIAEMKNHWEYITMMVEQRIVIKDYGFSILAAKEDGEKNAQTTNKFIQYVNENPLSDLRVIYVMDRVSVIMEFYKVVQNKRP